MAGNFNPGDDDSLLANSAMEGVTPDAEDDADADAAEAKENEKILEEAKARLAVCVEAESEIRKLALEDLEFRAGNQWPESIRQERQNDGRPCLVINRIPQFVQQVTNDQRQNRPAIKVHPIDDQADDDTAEMIQGLIRHIEYNSNADVAYDTAFEGAVTSGLGYHRVVTGFASPTSFDQEIFIKRIRNPFSVFFDPYSQEPDGSDANFAFVVEDLSPDQCKEKHPDSELGSNTADWTSIGNSSPGWFENGSARIAEYFYKEFKDVTLCQLSDGTVIEKDKLADLGMRMAELNPGQPVTIQIVNERQTKIPVIKWCKLNAVEVLEKTEWPGKYIPIIPTYGTDLYINGKRILEGIVRHSKDPQRMLNYWKSAETEAIALAPRAPFLVAEGTIEGYEGEWATANRRNHAFLTYRPKSIDGSPVPPPQRQAFEPAVQAITQAAMMAADDLKSTTGIYDSALGAQSNESSGIAIQRRNTQTQTSNFHFVDNLSRSIKHTGRILVDLIPRIYDTARSARILGEDGTQEIVKLNQEHVDPDTGKPVLYDLSAGTYDVTVDVGPSYASKRQEAVSAMVETTRAVPQLMQIAGDIMIKNMDWPGAQEIAERMRKMLPPQLQDDGKGQAALPPQVQSQMQQMSDMIKKLSDGLHAAHDTIDQKKVELESKERIEFAKIQAEIEIAMAKMGSQESMALLQHQLAEIENRMELIRADQAITFQSEQVPISPPLSAPNPTGGMPAQGNPTPEPPTGGASPGPSMEGNPTP